MAADVAVSSGPGVVLCDIFGKRKMIFIVLEMQPCKLYGTNKSNTIILLLLLDPALLWLGRRPVATAPIQPLAGDPPYAAGVAQRKSKKKKKKRKKNQKFPNKPQFRTSQLP